MRSPAETNESAGITAQVSERSGMAPRLLVGAAIVTGAALRLLWPTRHSLWTDEGTSLIHADGSLAEVIRRLADSRTSEHFQPLYFLLLQPWLRVGRSDLWLKGLGIALAIAALIAFHHCSRRLLGEHAGAMATILLAFSSFQVYYAQEVRPYALISLVTVAQLWAYAAIRSNGCEIGVSRRRSLVFAAVNGVAMFASVFQAFLLLALSLSDLLLAGRPSSVGVRLRGWLGRWAPSAAAALPAMAFFLLLGPSSSEAAVPRQLAGPVEGLLYSGFGLLYGSTLAPPPDELRGEGRLGMLLSELPALGLGALAGAGIVWAVVGTWTRRSSRRGRAGSVLTLATVLGFVLFLAFAAATGTQWLPRHSAFLSPLLALVAGYHSSGQMTLARRGSRLVGTGLVLGLVTLNLWSLWRYYFDDRYLKDDYRSVGGVLKANPDTPALMVWGNVSLLRHYGAGRLWGYRDLPPRRTSAELREHIGPGEEVFLVVNRPYYWSDLPVESLVNGYSVTERIDLPGFHLYRLRGSDALGEPGSASGREN
jgi:hypothetical protein